MAHRPQRPVGPQGLGPSGTLTQPDVTGKTNNNLTNDCSRCDIRGKKITDPGAERSHCPREGLRPGRRSPPSEESGPGEAAWKDKRRGLELFIAAVRGSEAYPRRRLHDGRPVEHRA